MITGFHLHQLTDRGSLISYSTIQIHLMYRRNITNWLNYISGSIQTNRIIQGLSFNLWIGLVQLAVWSLFFKPLFPSSLVAISNSLPILKSWKCYMVNLQIRKRKVPQIPMLTATVTTMKVEKKTFNQERRKLICYHVLERKLEIR